MTPIRITAATLDRSFGIICERVTLRLHSADGRAFRVSEERWARAQVGIMQRTMKETT